MNKRAVGTSYELKARSYLESHGIEIITTNFRTRAGEIDIIGKEKDCLLFIEVKYRSHKNQGGAMYAISAAKKNTICRVAAGYLACRNLPADTLCRFDAVLIDEGEINYIRNAWQRG